MSAKGGGGALQERLRPVARFLAAALVGGLVAGAIFLIMVQGSFRKGYTDLDFNHVLGTLVQGTAEETTGTNEALGVVGDTAGPVGLWSAAIAAIVLMAIHGLTGGRIRRHWTIQALPLAVLTFLVTGVIYPLVADSRLDTPTGLFGADAGGLTPLVLGLSSLGFALVGARVWDLVSSAGWWEERAEGWGAALENMAELEPASLELPEEGGEQRRVGA